MPIDHPKYYMLHKPAGLITARFDERHHTVMECFSTDLAKELFPIGRLDKDTEGLLLFTNDGVFCNQLMQPESHVKKTYYFHALGTLGEEACAAFKEGVCINRTSRLTVSHEKIVAHKLTAPAELTLFGQNTVGDYTLEFRSQFLNRPSRTPLDYPVTTGTLTISEGKKHQVKRMLLSQGCRIFYLKRIAIGSLELDPTLEKGAYRALSDDELSLLFL